MTSVISISMSSQNDREIVERMTVPKRSKNEVFGFGVIRVRSNRKTASSKTRFFPVSRNFQTNRKRFARFAAFASDSSFRQIAVFIVAHIFLRPDFSRARSAIACFDIFCRLGAALGVKSRYALPSSSSFERGRRDVLSGVGGLEKRFSSSGAKTEPFQAVENRS